MEQKTLLHQTTSYFLHWHGFVSSLRYGSAFLEASFRGQRNHTLCRGLRPGAFGHERELATVARLHEGHLEAGGNSRGRWNTVKNRTRRLKFVYVRCVAAGGCSSPAETRRKVRPHILRCLPQSATAAIGRNCLSVTGSRPRLVAGKNRIASWMSGASHSKFMICVNLARLTCPKRANSA